MLGSHNYVEPIVFLTCATSFAYLTIESQFVYQFVSESLNFTSNHTVKYCSANQTDETSRQEQDIANSVSQWTKIAKVLQGITSTISILVITSWSEKIGRRNALLFPVVGALICSSVQLINIHFRISLVLFVINSFIYGATGGWNALMNVSTAHLSDTIGKKQRTMRYTILEVCASFGGGLTQSGTGHWVTTHGFLPSSIFIVCCGIVSLLLTMLLKSGNTDTSNINVALQSMDEPEEEIPEKKRGISIMFTQLKEVFRIYTSGTIKCDACDKEGIDCVHCNGPANGRVWRLWFYLFTYAVYMATVNGISLFSTMFLVNFPLCFSPTLIGIQSGLASTIMIISPLILKFLRSLLRLSNQSILLIAIIGRIITSIILFWAGSAFPVFIGTVIGALSNLTTPFIRLQVSNLVSPSEQGPALALIPSISQLASAATPVMILSIYTATLYIKYSFIWVVMVFMFLIPFILMTIVQIADKCIAAKSDEPSQVKN